MDADKAILASKVAVFMKMGGNYYTASGVKFTQEQPYQLMNAVEAYSLIEHGFGRFRLAEPEEVRDFYGKQKG